MGSINEGKKLVDARKRKKTHDSLLFTSRIEMLQAHLYNLSVIKA